MVRIVHASKNTLKRAGLRRILDNGGGIGALTDADDMEHLLSILSEQTVDVLMGEFDDSSKFGLSDLADLKNRYPDLKVLVVSTDSDQEHILRTLELGVEGYLTRECDEGELVNAVFSLFKGEKFYCNKVINILLNKSVFQTDEDDCAPTALSSREQEIITLIAEGKTNKETADLLHLSVHTVHTHRRNIMKKLRVNSTSGLVLYAVKAGFVTNPI
jgi:DNA-binding NarL/FixJ family response regulator